MKTLPRTVLALYVLVLLWLVLFKFSSDPLSILSNFQTRGLNLIPFAGISGHLNEVLYNVVAFIPLGLLLDIKFRHSDFWRKLAYICMFSFAVEIIQFVFAIGRTDTTDVITNTIGGFIGLKFYEVAKRYIDNERLDRFITITILSLTILFLLLRVLVFRVRYQAH